LDAAYIRAMIETVKNRAMENASEMYPSVSGDTALVRIMIVATIMGIMTRRMSRFSERERENLIFDSIVESSRILLCL